jgi:hypothetical protein
VTKLILVPLALAAFGCSEEKQVSDVYDKDVGYYSTQIKLSAPEGSIILALCGASTGKAYYIGNSEDSREWIDDSINNGRQALVELPDGTLDMFFRGVDGILYSALKDGGKVTYLYKKNEGKEFGVLVHYASTGVTETHNFMWDEKLGRVNLWTSNKNIESGISIRKVTAFVSKCAK